VIVKNKVFGGVVPRGSLSREREGERERGREGERGGGERE